MSGRTLTDADVEAIAERVAEHMAGSPRERLLTVPEVAEMLSCSTDWVYEHQVELGVKRLGDGPAAPLRFDRRRIEQWLAEHTEEPAPVIAARRPGPEPGEYDFPILPIPGEAA